LLKVPPRTSQQIRFQEYDKRRTCQQEEIDWTENFAQQFKETLSLDEGKLTPYCSILPRPQDRIPRLILI
jgi:hypothetical protein